MKLLMYLAEKGALHKEIELSTTKMSADLQSSQQTISRKLIDLEERGFLNRQASTRGIKLMITGKGREELQTIYNRLHSVFGNPLRTIKGMVETGLKEGAYYMSLPGYKKQFKEKLGIDAFPGTLNLRVDYNEFLQFIAGKDNFLIERFSTKERTFGRLDAYKVTVNRIPCAIVIPHRTSHDKTIMEIISHTHFRKEFNLKDGNSIEVQ